MGQDAGQNIPHGMGQSKSSRRRRRKRKGKGPEGVMINGAGQSVGEAGEGESAQASPQGGEQSQPQARPQGSQAGGGQQQNGTGTGTKRWKKKFRERDRQRPSDNPGNQANAGSNGASNGLNNGAGSGGRDRDTHQFGNNGFKQRKGGGGGKQQRGPRSFVGPMDHSYRAVNGNFADTPPSTIEPHGNYGSRNGGGHGRGGGYHSDSQPIDYSQGKTIPIPDDAQTKIFFLHRRFILRREDPGDSAQAGREGRVPEER